ncbi:hypothetical protein AB0O28_05060 [Microbispora sp. NPDC088329]|uniref:hypothetical protein n=1 Tax=Microbispora sp. NPDC088329 TaxID=3154869 RepID=UPI0034214CE6
MNSSVVARLVIVLVAVIGVAGTAAVLLVITGPGAAGIYSVSHSTPVFATISAAPSPAAALPEMPRLWFQDVKTARTTIAALGFDLEVRSLTGDEVEDPADWIVVGQAPAPGDHLKNTIPIEVDVLPKDMPVPNPTTRSGSPSDSTIEPSTGP